VLHVDPGLKERGLAILFNPLEGEVTRKIRLPLYYTGLADRASIREKGGAAREYRLDRGYGAEVEVRIPGRGWTWLLVEGEGSRQGR
jgi:hypothetical protein